MVNRLVFLLVFVLFSANAVFAKDQMTDVLQKLIKLEPNKITMNKVSTLIGKPTKVEETGKKTKWYYVQGQGTLILNWENNTYMAKKITYNEEGQPIKKALDYGLLDKLKSGSTDLVQAYKILGLPKDMTIKEQTQEMHYSYENKVLRLFFRKRILVDFALY